MAVEKRRSARRTALGLAALAAVWSLGVWPAPAWWRTHWPRETAMQRRASEKRNAPTFVPLGDISPALQRMVIIAEDSRFRTHHGVDFVEIGDALGLERGAGVWGTARAVWRRRDRLRGASTITQQLAKNFYLSPSRNPFRKVKEAITAVRLELALPKDRILELYLNVVEFGPGIWGVDAASRSYFGVSPAGLSEEQAAELAATLPFPRSSNPRDHPARMLARRDLILARYHGVPVYIPPLEDVDVLAEDSLTPDSLRLDTLKVDTMPLPDTILPDTIVTDTVRDTLVDTLGADAARERQTVARKTFLTTVHGFTLLAGAPVRLVHQP
jgi:monofunctional glycosyltransferase